VRKGASRDSREGGRGYKRRGPGILGPVVDVRGQFGLRCGAVSPEGTVLFSWARTSYEPAGLAMEKGQWSIRQRESQERECVRDMQLVGGVHRSVRVVVRWAAQER
jgi:hypothetical protein